jgi:hypothetical protein
MKHFFSAIIGERPECGATLTTEDALTLVPHEVTCRACLKLLGRLPPRDDEGGAEPVRPETRWARQTATHHLSPRAR